MTAERSLHATWTQPCGRRDLVEGDGITGALVNELQSAT
jgi:hypothetical protein